MTKSSIGRNAGGTAGGIVGGLGAGLVVSALALGGVSLMAPPPETSRAPQTSATQGLEAAITPPPEDSEFGKGPSAAVVPPQTTEPLRTPTGPVAVKPPVKEASPAIETDPDAKPNASDAPETPTAPPAATAALQHPIEGESPIPVPPPGEAIAPALGLPSADGTFVDPAPDTDLAPDQIAALPAPSQSARPTTAPPAQAETAPQRADAPPVITPPSPSPESSIVADGATAPDSMMPQDAPPPDAPTVPDAPAVIVLDEPSAPAGRPATGFQNSGNVTLGRLPSIGEAGTPDAPATIDVLSPEALPPVQAYALPFAVTGSTPLYSVVLVDPGAKAGGLDPATLKTIGFPVTLAIDPTRPDAQADAETYRAAGFEVAILASSLPEGATEQDLEVAVEAWRQIIPEAIAIVEPAQPVLQTNRLLSQGLVKILAREGLGLITQSGGLNAAEQLAEKEGVPHTKIWRVIDDGREKAPVIERMLGRAGFEASKDGAVAVMLSAWPESLSGLLTWEPSRDKDIALAPVSALALSGM